METTYEEKSAPISVRWGAIAEVLVVYVAVMLGAYMLLRGEILDELTRNQRGMVMKLFLFLMLPAAITLISRRSALKLGFNASEWRTQLRMGWRGAFWLLTLASWPIAVIELLGTNYREWPGALVLVVLHIAVLVFVARSIRPLESPGEITPALRVLLGLCAAVLVSFAAIWILLGQVPFLPRLIDCFVLVGLAEELLFRGYMQERLNDAFGRPWQFLGVTCGPALILAAVLFGLMHALVQTPPRPWAWAAWTVVVGLTCGLLREKSRGVLAPALAHALYVVPTAFFS